MEGTLVGDFWIGVDMAKASFDAAASRVGPKPDDWRRLKTSRFANTEEGAAAFVAWARSLASGGGRCLGVCVESTGCYSSRWIEALEGSGLPRPSMINPLRSVSFAKSAGARNKNDRVDAAILAVFGALFAPPISPKLPPAQSRTRELDRLRQSLVQQKNAWENRLADVRDGFARDSVAKVIEALDQQIGAVDAELEKGIMEDETLAEQVRLLETIPGIKRVTAMTLTVEFGDLRRFSRDQLVGAAGLFPREHTSGTSVKKRGRMAKGGGRRVRRDLYMGATSLQRSKGALGAFVHRLIGSGMEPMRALGALMRKMILVARAVVVSRQPYDPVKAGRKCPFQVQQGAITAQSVTA